MKTLVFVGVLSGILWGTNSWALWSSPLPSVCQNMETVGSQKGYFLNVREDHPIKAIQISRENGQVQAQLIYRQEGRRPRTIVFHHYGSSGYLRYSVESLSPKYGEKWGSDVLLIKTRGFSSNLDPLLDSETAVKLFLEGQPDLPQMTFGMGAQSEMVFTRFPSKEGLRHAMKEGYLTTIATKAKNIAIVEQIGEREFYGPIPYIVQTNLIRNIHVDLLLKSLRPFRKVLIDGQSFWISIYNPDKNSNLVFVSKFKPNDSTTSLYVVAADKTQKWRAWYLGGD